MEVEGEMRGKNVMKIRSQCHKVVDVYCINYFGRKKSLKDSSAEEALPEGQVNTKHCLSRVGLFLSFNTSNRAILNTNS